MISKKIAVLGLLAASVAMASSPYTKQFSEGKPALQSMGNLTFGPDGILFIGDSIGGKVVAVDLKDRKTNDSVDPLDIADLEGRIGSLLGVDAADVLVHDMAINPISQNVYLTVSRGRQLQDSRWKLPNDVANADILLRLSDGKFSEVKLDKVSHQSLTLPNPVNAKDMIEWKKAPLRVDAISDMAYHDGKLYVAGLSNEEFASTMRVAPFPFDGGITATSLEIFHGAHAKYETNSPVRAFVPYTIKGKPHLLAAYLCTPLVSFEVDSLKDKQHVKGRTLAELGWGNYPLDMVAYQSDGKDYIMLINNARGLMRFSAEALNKFEGQLTSELDSIQAGLEFDPLPGSGYQQMDKLNAKNLATIIRKANGRLDLISMRLR